MTDQELSSLDQTLASLRADREARQFDGARFEDAVLRHARDIPGWVVSSCWRFAEWPDRATGGVPLPTHDAGIDLVAVNRDWSPVQWFDPKLAAAAAELRAESGMCRLAALYRLGPAGQRIRDAFERVTDGSTTERDVAVFDSVSSDRCVSLAGRPDAVWRPRPGKERMARSYLERTGWALLMNRGRAKNARLVGLCAESRSFGSGFMPVVTGTVAQAKALCLVWNSTPALLQLLNMRTKMLTYLNWSVAQLGSVRVPASLDDAESRASLIATYDRVCRARLQPWACADADLVRREIDGAVAEAYGLSGSIVADWRERLAKEPTIANRSAL